MRLCFSEKLHGVRNFQISPTFMEFGGKSQQRNSSFHDYCSSGTWLTCVKEGQVEASRCYQMGKQLVS